MWRLSCAGGGFADPRPIAGCERVKEGTSECVAHGNKGSGRKGVEQKCKKAWIHSAKARRAPTSRITSAMCLDYSSAALERADQQTLA